MRTVKFELYKLIREPFLWTALGIILIVSFVMIAGTTISITEIAQKSFFISVIASLFAAFYVGSDIENGRILYTILSGNTRFNLILAKTAAVTLSSELLILPFPCLVILHHMDWNMDVIWKIIVNYFFYGIFSGVLGLSIACLFRNPGIAVIGVVLFHLGTLFLMNSQGAVGLTAMRVIPIGIVKLSIDGMAGLYSFFIFAGWIILPLIGITLNLKYRDL